MYKFSVRKMDSQDGCACRIEEECFPAEQRMGLTGIEQFLRQSQNGGLTVVEHWKPETDIAAYYRYLRRGGKNRPDSPMLREQDWGTKRVMRKGDGW